jgi:type IV secretory pathway VirB6-like protein
MGGSYETVLTIPRNSGTAADDVVVSRSRDSSILYRLVGLCTLSLVSALFWTGIAAALSYYLGSLLSGMTLFLIAVAIAVVVALVCAPLFLRRQRSTVA